MTELDENFENEYNPRIKKILFIGFAILYIRLCAIYKEKPLDIDDVMKEAYRLTERQDESEDKSEVKYEAEYYYIELITNRINITVNNIIKDSDEIKNQKEYIKTVEFLLYNFDLEKTKKIIKTIKKIITEIKNDDDDDNIQKKKGNSVVPQPLSIPSAAPSSYSGSSHTPFFNSGSTLPMTQQPFGYSQHSTNYHPSNGTVERVYVGGKKIRKNKVI
jgi:hypothetical protein